MPKRKKPKLLIFVVAYNAEKTIETVLSRIPASLVDDYRVEVLIIDDSSPDATFEQAARFKDTRDLPFDVHVLFNPVNQGYGGNQKIGYHFAIERGFDYVALVHGDGQYAPESLPDLVAPLRDGAADAVFGSRMLARGDAVKGGMPLCKFVGNKILSCFENYMLGTRLSEFHSGYRVYSVDALKRVPFALNTNDFHFDTEIIVQFVFAGLRIEERPIPTYYGDEICHVDGLKYAWHVSKTVLVARAGTQPVLRSALRLRPGRQGQPPLPGEVRFRQSAQHGAQCRARGRPRARPRLRRRLHGPGAEGQEGMPGHRR